jgi:hypothetical protein
MAANTDQATDLRSSSADLANRASVSEKESLDGALKDLNCLAKLSLIEIYPWRVVSRILGIMGLS